MKKNIYHWELFGFFFIGLLGLVVHFGLELIPSLKPISFMFAVSESVWEHLKLVFWPAVFLLILEAFFIKGKVNNFFIAKGISILVMIAFIVTVFYTYSGIIGRNYLIADISLFYIATLIGQIVSYKILIAPSFKNEKQLNILFIIIILILVLLFTYFTYNPPHIPLFMD